MIDQQTAQLIVSIARNALDHGRELEPHQVADLEIIAADSEFRESLRNEASAMLAIEVAA